MRFGSWGWVYCASWVWGCCGDYVSLDRLLKVTSFCVSGLYDRLSYSLGGFDDL
jgi:hypothetical protein